MFSAKTAEFDHNVGNRLKFTDLTPEASAERQPGKPSQRQIRV
jgi:hypothetical protein